MKNTIKKRYSLSRRILVQIAVLTLVMTAVIVAISFVAIKATYLRQLNDTAQAIVRILANSVDGDKLDAYVQTGVTDEYYESVKKQFDQVKYSIEGVKYLYLFKPYPDHFVYILEGIRPDDDPEETSYLGDTFYYGEMEFKHLVPDIEAGRASTALIVGDDNGYGVTISAWAPVLNSDGEVAGMVEADCTLNILNTDVRTYAILGIVALLVCMLGLRLSLYWILQRSVTHPLKQLTEMVNSYEHGSMNEVKMRQNDEFQKLATSFADMTKRIDTYTVEVAKASAVQERISAESNIAKQIQTDILPKEFPAFPNRNDFDIAANIELAKEISGDFYDYFMVDKDHLAMVVGDVSDKGIPAALVMVIVKTLIKDRILQGSSPAETLQIVNEQLLESNQAGMFCMVWLAILDLSNGKGIAVNAGHEHPILRRVGKRFELQEYRHFPPVGAMDNIRFRDHGFQMEPGDTLFVHTDGLKEAVNQRDELYGVPRILETLNRDPEATPSVIIQTMKSSVDHFCGGAEYADSVAFMAMKYYGPGGAKDMW